MKNIILSIVMIAVTATPSLAGIGVCHDGSGSVTLIERDGNYTYFSQTANCEYYSIPPLTPAEFQALKTLLQNTPKKYLKFDNGVVEMTQAEKDAVDAAQSASNISAKRQAIKDYFADNPEIRVLLEVIVDEFNRNRSWDSKPAITNQDVINAIEAKIDAGNFD